MVTYTRAPQVTNAQVGSRPVLINAQGGRVAVDPQLLKIWQAADGQTLEQLIARFDARPTAQMRAALACLAQAGLLIRDKPIPGRPTSLATGPLVSVVIVAYNSRAWLAECLPSLMNQSYHPLQVLVVDNASGDQASEWVETNYPQVRIVRLATEQSFAFAVNCGIRQSAGDYVLILNPDVRLEADAVAQLVAVAREDPSCAAVAPKLRFWWAPAFLNGLGNRVGAVGWGSDNMIGHLDLEQFDGWRLLPSASFAAALIVRSIWERIGPLDDKFPMYYEDSEWSYRARMLGYSVRAAPHAVVYHALGSRVASGETSALDPRKLRHVVYGRLRFAARILGFRYLVRFVFNYVLEDTVNLVLSLGRRKWASGRAYLGAWIDFLRDIPALTRERDKLQTHRVCSDKELFALQSQIPGALVWRGLPELSWDLVTRDYLPLFVSGKTRPMPEFQNGTRRPHLLIVSNDVVDAHMGGVGVRYLEIARALKDDLAVALAVPSETLLEIEGIHLVRYSEDRAASLQVLVENSDVVLLSGYLVEKFPFLSSVRARLVIDLYDPFFLENLFYYLDEPMSAQETLNDHALEIANQLARLGDYFICGSERQRDFWLGVLAANKRVNPRTFDQDPTLNALIGVVGVGFPDREPRHQPILRGVHPAFPPDARIVLWGGGIWNWLDPLTLVRAWPAVAARFPAARLVFLGTRHPNPLVPAHRAAQETVALAETLGEKDRTIFFFEWLPYEEREALLSEADIGVTLQPAHIETRFSIRTRVVDYLWARLPVLISEGDVTAQWIRQYKAGRVVPPLNSAAVADALIELLGQPKAEASAGFEPVRDQFHWCHVVAPLRQYCLQGTYAPDRLLREKILVASPRRSRRALLARAVSIWRLEGLAVLIHRVKRYVQWRLSSI